MPHFVFLIDIREGYSTLFDIFINSYLLPTFRLKLFRRAIFHRLR